MPSPHSSAETQDDARTIAANLGARADRDPDRADDGQLRAALRTPSAYRRHAPAGEALPRDPARPSEPDLAAENIQARIRGNLMMALSNKHGWLVLTTGNKSEMSVGYATLYGDMAGGFAVIKDVPKTLVYELVRRRNERAGRELVPASVIDRPPSAELRPDQLDEDSLPPYEVLDRILEAYVERDQGSEEMVAAGMPAGRRRRGDPHGRPGRVQAAPGAAGDQDHAEGVRRATGACRSRTASAADGLARARPHDDSHPRQGAELARGIVNLCVPDPGGATPVAGLGLHLDVALGSRAQEGDVDRLAHRHHPVGEDGEGGRT